MKTPTDLEREQLIHLYDPVKAHEYYLRRRHLKGRKSGAPQDMPLEKPGAVAVVAPKHAKKTKVKVKVNSPRAEQRKRLAVAITNLQSKLTKLEALIQQKEREANSVNQKHQAKKNARIKAKHQPRSALQKVHTAQQNRKYRQQHQQKLKTQARQRSSSKSGGSGGGSPAGSSSGPSLSELKSLAVKVRGQIAVAKQKLAAL